MTDPRITKELIEAVVEVIKERTGYGYGGGNTTEVALATLEAAFALLPEPGPRLSIRQQAVQDRVKGIRRTDMGHNQEGYDNCWEDPYWSDQ